MLGVPLSAETKRFLPGFLVGDKINDFGELKEYEQNHWN